MNAKLKQYKNEVMEQIKHYMNDTTTCASDYAVHKAVKEMLETVYFLDKLIKEDAGFDYEMAKDWVAKMQPPAKWTIEETTAVANQFGVKFEHITEYCWWVAMNKMWSDHYETMAKHKIEDVSIYVDLAKDWLFDADSKVSPKEKLAITYNQLMK